MRIYSFGPVALEGLARHSGRRHWYSAYAVLLLDGEAGDPIVQFLVGQLAWDYVATIRIYPQHNIIRLAHLQLHRERRVDREFYANDCAAGDQHHVAVTGAGGCQTIPMGRELRRIVPA